MKPAVKLLLFLIMVSGLTITQCFGTVSSEEKQLSYKEVILVRMRDEGRMVAVPDAVFRRGEVVDLVLLGVGKFQKGDDGKHWIDIDLLVKDPTGSVILDNKGLLGEKGHRLLKDDIASSPYGVFESGVGLEPGVYQMTLTIFDKISGAKISVTKSFTLSPGLSYQKTLFAKKGSDGALEPVRYATFSRGEMVNMIFIDVGKFKKGADGKHLFDIDIKVKNSDGKLIFQKEKMLGENGHILLENDIAKSPYGIFYTSIKMESGVYHMTMTIYDKISGEQVSVTKPFTLE